MQPVSAQKLELVCQQQGSDWRTHTRMLLWHHMATSMIRQTNREIANEIQV